MTKQSESKEKIIELGGEPVRIGKKTVPIEPKRQIKTKEFIKRLEKATQKRKVFPEFNPE